MRVALNITVEVDAAAWAEEYGIERREVRADVRRYVETALAECPVPLLAVAAAPKPAAEPAHERTRPGDATTGTPVTPGGRETGAPTPGGPQTRTEPTEGRRPLHAEGSGRAPTGTLHGRGPSEETPGANAAPTRVDSDRSASRMAVRELGAVGPLRPAVPAPPPAPAVARPARRRWRLVPALVAAVLAAVLTAAGLGAGPDREPAVQPAPGPAVTMTRQAVYAGRHRAPDQPPRPDPHPDRLPSHDAERRGPFRRPAPTTPNGDPK